jgi:hypothetical protein
MESVTSIHHHHSERDALTADGCLSCHKRVSSSTSSTPNDCRRDDGPAYLHVPWAVGSGMPWDGSDGEHRSDGHVFDSLSIAASIHNTEVKVSTTSQRRSVTRETTYVKGNEHTRLVCLFDR